jgi:hypothetical protein
MFSHLPVNEHVSFSQYFSPKMCAPMGTFSTGFQVHKSETNSSKISKAKRYLGSWSLHILLDKWVYKEKVAAYNLEVGYK